MISSHLTRQQKLIIAGLITAATWLSLIGLVGWFSNSPDLKNFFSSGVSMKFNTSLSLVLLCSSLIALCWVNRLCFWLSLSLNFLLNIATLTEYISRRNLGIDQLFFRDSDKFYASTAPGRTALITTVVILLILCSVLLATLKKYKASQLLSFIAFLATYATLLFHSFGVMKLYYSPEYSGMAMHTAISLTLLIITLWVYQVRKGWLIYLFKNMRNTSVFRHLLVYLLICSPFFVASYIRIAGSSSLSPEYGTIIIMLLVCVFCVPFAYYMFQAIDRMEDDLRRSKERLDLALQAGALGSYDLNFITGEIECNERFRTDYDFSENEKVTFDKLLERILPEFHESTRQRIKEAMISGEHYQVEYRIAHKNGLTYWIRASGQAHYNLSGKATNVVGVTWVILGREKETKELERAYQSVKLSTQAAQLGMFDTDIQSGLIECDSMCRMLFGMTEGVPVKFERDFVNNIHPEDREKVLRHIGDAQHKEHENGIFNIKFRAISSIDRKVRWVHAKGQVYFNDAEHPVRLTGTIADVTDQQESEMLKNDFIAMVSHELKTPLTTLKAYIQVLLSKARKGGDDYSLSALGKADNQITKMGNMIKGFLDVSRLESGRMALNKTAFDINDLIAETINDLNTATSCSHNILIEKSDAPMVLADREKIAHVLTNLIGNACKYSEPGKKIWVSGSSTSSGLLEVAIKDEGMGIAPAHLGSLFERYYRVDNQKTANIAGFGIGLYLCSEIIKLHKGLITAESTVGEGSVFKFSIDKVIG